MVLLPRPVTIMISVQPAAMASSTPYWMSGLSTRHSISFGMDLVAGRKRVPIPAAGKTALRIFLIIDENLYRGSSDGWVILSNLFCIIYTASQLDASRQLGGLISPIAPRPPLPVEEAAAVGELHAGIVRIG